jgi:hypothetical protein
MRIAHLADIHVKDRRRDEYEAVFASLVGLLKTEEPIDYIAIAGDVFDTMSRASAHNWEDVAGLLDRLADVATVVLIPGNHDLNVRAKGAPDLIGPMIRAAGGAAQLQPPRVIYWRDSGVYELGGALWVVGVPGRAKYPTPEQVKAGLAGIPAGAPLIGLYHESVGGARFPNGMEAKDTPLQKSDLAVITAVAGDRPCAFLLGDIHLRQEVTFPGCGPSAAAWYPGSLVCQHFGESHLGHGYLMWEVKNGEVAVAPREVPNAVAPLTIRLGSDGGDITALPKPESPQAYRIIYHPRISQHTLRETVVKTTEMYKFGPRSVEAHAGAQGADPKGPELPQTLERAQQEGGDWARHEMAAREILKVSPDAVVKAAIARYRNEVQESLGSRAVAPRVELAKLQFDNMFCFGPGNTIDFDAIRRERPGLIGFVAQNQFGKSSLFDIITFALCDEVPRGSKSDVPRKGGPGYRLRLTFRIDGVEGRIEKTGSRGELKRSDNRIRLWLGDDELTADTLPETAIRARNLLGGRRWLDSVVFLRPQEVTGHPSFALASPAERRRTLSALLDLGSYEALLKKADIEIRGLRGERRALLGLFPSLPKYIPEGEVGDFLGRLLKSFDDTSAQVKAELNAAETQHLQSREVARAAEATLNELMVAESRQEARRTAAVEAAQRAHSALSQIAASWRDARDRVAAMRRLVDREPQVKDAIAVLERKLHSHDGVASFDAAKAQQRLDSLGPGPARDRVSLMEIRAATPRPKPPAEDAIEAARVALETSKVRAAKHKETVARLNKLRERVGAVCSNPPPPSSDPCDMAQVTELVRELTRMREAQETHAICQSLSKTWVVKCSGCNAARAALGDRRAARVARIRDLGPAVLGYLGRKAEATALGPDELPSVLSHRLDGMRCATRATREWDNAKSVVDDHRERTRLRSQLRLAREPGVLREDLAAAQADLREIHVALGRLDSATCSIARLKEEAAEANQLTKTVNDEVAEATRSGADAQLKTNSAKAVLARARADEEESLGELSRLRTAHARAQAKAASCSDNIDKAVVADMRVAVCAAYRKILHPKNGVGARFLEKAVAGVTEQIESALRTMESSFTVEFSHDYEMALVDRRSGTRTPPALGSGYQQFVMAIAVRWALAQVTRIPMPTYLMIDEGFGCLDNENLCRVVDALGMLALKTHRSGTRPLIMAVTHLEELRPHFATCLGIERADHESLLRYPDGDVSDLSDLSLSVATPSCATVLCAACSIRVAPEAWEAHIRSEDHVKKAEGAPAETESPAEVARNYCEDCERSIAPQFWKRHPMTATHKKCATARVERDEVMEGDPAAQKAPSRRVACTVCPRSVTGGYKSFTPKQWARHVKTKGHLKHLES